MCIRDRDETDGNTASKKLALCQERLDILQQEVTVNGEKKPLFDDNTLFASKWSQLQARYELLSKQKDWKTYLSITDVQNLNISGDTLKNSLTANQQKAQKYLCLLYTSCNEKTILASCMMVNSETGAIHDLPAIADVYKRQPATAATAPSSRWFPSSGSSR